MAFVAACGTLCLAAWEGGNPCVLAGVRIQGEAPTPVPASAMLVVYADGMTAAPYVPSGWMGNQHAIRLDARCTEHAHSGDTCMKLEYRSPGEWGGIIWQDPPNDWGDKPGGHDLSGAKALTFWARGETGGEKVKFVVGVIKPEKPYYDTAAAELEVALTREWAQYSIDLTGKDLSRIKTGFGWTLAGQGKPLTFYLDDVKYE